jgi:nucleoside phosphorylase
MKRAVIFTAKPTETEAVKEQLIGPIGNPRTAQTYVYDTYKLKAKIGGSQAADDIEIALYETGRGQEKVLPSVAPIVGEFNPDLVVFVGCAGGDPNEIKVYDVLVPTDVWPYEKGKETKAGFKSRAFPMEPTGYLLDQTRAIANRSKWRMRVPKRFQLDAKGKRINSTVSFEMLASGNKVLADDRGAIWKTVKALNDEIVAVETEGFAFFQAMRPLHRPHLLIRGISDLLANKNTAGAQVDDDRQTRSTAHAAALAAQLILEAKQADLRRNRGAEQLDSYDQLKGFWLTEWSYGAERCRELLHIEEIDTLGRVSGRRASTMADYEYLYDLSGILYKGRLHLTAILSRQDKPFSISLVLKTAGNFGESLTGIAIRPLGNNRPKTFGPNVLVHGKELWASTVRYKRMDKPEKRAADLWAIFERGQ